MKPLAHSRFFFCIQTLLVVLLCLFVHSTEAAAPSEMYPGSRGEDVWDLQYRLYLLGLYNGRINGIVSEKTVAAVRAFQRQQSLPTTGVVDRTTEKRLQQVSLSGKELNLLARLVYAEGRGEPYQGQVAIAAVVLNRIHAERFPDTMRGVVFAPGAFSSVRDGRLPKQTNQTARRAVLDALRGSDPSQGSFYFFNPETATSTWIWSRPQAVHIGNHIFAH
ncbi:cell wall hydrolase [Brevibacillus humidisoli]|uniref:cell wall hydrolase n=1 Tax=Brevibacillus humidisoli TaxID=2895522 RepID=UPI001E2BC7CE|nr:cell wall hydrolase [Brevibacillus humidisoli]UFJ43247.1 cell wall hydrolase [Brevibacillus humidisoli]